MIMTSRKRFPLADCFPYPAISISASSANLRLASKTCSAGLLPGAGKTGWFPECCPPWSGANFAAEEFE